MKLKLGTELNIALDTPKSIREKSFDLNAGYNKELDSWRLIIRYIGNLEEIAALYGGIYTELLGGFAIIEIREEDILDFAADSRVIYIEKPKLFYQNRTSVNGFVESCMNVPYFDMGLKGEGITVAIIDSGIDIFHPDFLSDYNGEAYSKITGIWDQTVFGNPPAGYNLGTYFDALDIANAINDNDGFISIDVSGHGTAVAGIISACTPMAKLLIVKLDTSMEEQVDTINLMLGIDFVVRYSIDNELPIVINLSYGNNDGDHDGNSVLEKYIDYVSQISRITFVVGAGNDGVAGRHAQITIEDKNDNIREFQVPGNEKSINLQVWRNYQEQLDIFLKSPSGETIGPFNKANELMIYNVNNMDIRVLNNGPSPINVRQETYISIIPINEYIEAGVWTIFFESPNTDIGRVDIWLPVEGSTNTKLFFLNPSDSTTLTVPSTASNVITVGAYDSNTMSYASFSGRGYTVDGQIKPDIVAPGVDIDTALPGGGHTFVTGTSFAVPFVSSAAAMLMEYGIVRGNDNFLYGEKLKAYLIDGAKNVLGIYEYPDNRVGFGALCVEKSIL